jgi:MHS family citrate/tricarballylate:H+ symporter-like MFS transporter
MTDMAIGGPAAAPAAPSISRRHIAAAVVGNALEFYDFVTYAFFAVQIGHAFFPGHSDFIRLMLSLVTFGVGFVPRPLGALIIGRFGDRAGRRPAMLLSFGLMGVAILGLALTPTYAQIGPAAPVLVVMWRLIQGFALGGEVGPTTAFLVEAAPPAQRGFIGSWQNASQGFSSLIGGLTGVIISSLLGEAALGAWGWRIAFLIGALVLPYGLFIRRGLPETRGLPEIQSAAQPVGATLAAHWRIILLGLALIANGTITTYVFNFMTTYAVTTLKLGAGISLAASVVVGAMTLTFGLIGGLVSDRLGRRWMMIWPKLAFLLIAYPAFWMITHHRDGVTLLALTGLLVAVNIGPNTVALVAITESLRREVRSVVFAGIYATAVAVFGGATQLSLAWVIHVTGNPMAPAWFVIVSTVVGLTAAVLMKESAPER